MYFWGVIGTLCLESRYGVARARNWVMTAAKNMCHVVRNRADNLLRVPWYHQNHDYSRNSRCLALAFHTIITTISRLTEFCGGENPFVKENDAGAQSNPEPTCPSVVHTQQSKSARRTRYRRPEGALHRPSMMVLKSLAIVFAASPERHLPVYAPLRRSCVRSHPSPENSQVNKVTVGWLAARMMRI